jgi:hypothetical protein
MSTRIRDKGEKGTKNYKKKECSRYPGKPAEREMIRN